MKKLITILIFALIPTFGFSQAAKYIFPLNESSSVAGDDLHTTANAASVSNEADATTGWTASNTTMVSIGTDGGIVPNAGSYMMKGTRTGIGPVMYQAITVVDGDSYILSLSTYLPSDNTSTAHTIRVYDEGGASTGNIMATISVKTEDNWVDVKLEFTATTTVANIHIYAPGTNGDIVYFDNVVLRKKDASTRESQTGVLATQTDVYCVQDDKGSGRRWYELLTDDFLDTNTATLTGQVERSLFAKFRTTVGGGIYTECDAASADRGLVVQCNQATGFGEVFLMKGTGGTTLATVQGSVDLRDGEWHTITMTWDGTTDADQFAAWVDGVSIGTTTAAAVTQGGVSTTDAVIGANDGGAQNFLDGDIEMVRAFNDDQTANATGTGRYSIPSNPIKDADAANCVLNLNSEGVRSNQWVDYLNDITATNNGATMVIPPSSNLGASWFNGATSVIALAEDLVINTNKSSIVFWAQRQTISTVSHTVLGTTIDANINRILLSNADVFFITSTTLGDQAEGELDPIDFLWHFYVVTFNNKIVKMYQDGVPLNMTDDELSDDVITFNLIGRRRLGSDWYDGAIRFIEYYEEVLSQDFITNEYGKYYN